MSRGFRGVGGSRTREDDEGHSTTSYSPSRRSTYRRGSASNAPRWITARHESACPETGKLIRPGERCLWVPVTRQAYHESSATAANQRGQEFNTAFAMPDANY